MSRNEVAFTIDGAINRHEDGCVFIELIPSDPSAYITAQQIVDVVSEMLLWQGEIEITNAPDPNNLNS